MVQKEGESHESSLNKNLLKTYSSGKKAVDDIGIALESGEVFGFLGPNGAGKTTTVCSAVCLRPREEAAGCLTSTLPEPGKLHQVSGVVREQAQMYDYMTGLENLMFYGIYLVWTLLKAKSAGPTISLVAISITVRGSAKAQTIEKRNNAPYFWFFRSSPSSSVSLQG